MPPFELRDDVADMMSLTDIPINDDSLLNKTLQPSSEKDTPIKNDDTLKTA